MNREWRRAPVDLLCGYCQDQTIPKGTPALFIALPGVKRERIRCANCAGNAPPPLPELPIVAGVEEQAQRGFTKLGIPLKKRGDLKQAVREWMPYRESGEEG